MHLLTPTLWGNLSEVNLFSCDPASPLCVSEGTMVTGKWGWIFATTFATSKARLEEDHLEDCRAKRWHQSERWPGPADVFWPKLIGKPQPGRKPEYYGTRPRQIETHRRKRTERSWVGGKGAFSARETRKKRRERAENTCPFLKYDNLMESALGEYGIPSGRILDKGKGGGDVSSTRVLYTWLHQISRNHLNGMTVKNTTHCRLCHNFVSGSSSVFVSILTGTSVTSDEANK